MDKYWCVNCGHHGSFGFNRTRGVKCAVCNYTELCEWDGELPQKLPIGDQPELNLPVLIEMEIENEQD